MQHLVIVRPQADRYVAQSLTIPQVQAVAATEAEAVEQLTQSLAAWLASAKLVCIEVPVPNGGNPWLDTFGRSANDPDFAEFLAEVQRGRGTDASE